MGWMGLFGWLKKGKISYTKDIPFKRKDEKFRGFKITWPWWEEPEEKDEKSR